MMLDQIIAGDTLDFTDDAPDYPASDGWTLKYRLVPEFTAPAQTPITLTALTYETTRYRVQESSTNTAAWKSGFYSWARWVEKAGQRVSLGQGRLEVLPDPAATAAGHDGRTHARKVLEAIEAVLESRATKDQEEYSIAGRSLRRTSIPDLLVLRDKYKLIVASEDAAERASRGLGNSRNIQVRFGRA
jgi:hypothetical protein